MFNPDTLRHLIHAEPLSSLERFGQTVSHLPSGAPFFEAMLAFLWAVIDPLMLYVGAIEPPGETVRTLIAIRDGDLVENFQINLAHTPCAAVLGPQVMCIYTEGVADLFPRSRGLRTMHAEGYVGMPLLASDGTKLGIFTAVTGHAVDNIDEVRTLLYTFAGRLSLEVERRLLVGRGERSVAVDSAIAEAERAIIAAIGGAPDPAT